MADAADGTEPSAASVVTFLSSGQDIPMRVAACQKNSRQDKPASLATVARPRRRGRGDLAVLPEYFDYLGTDEGALAAAEPVPEPITAAIPARVRALGLWRLAGSLRAYTNSSYRPFHLI
jgi:predicted amidohydrolase